MEYAKLGPRRAQKKNRGIALILVLMLVVLTTILLLAFFLSVQTESKSVRSVISGQNSRQLADIAVQSVIAQIQQATTQGNTIAWASQPGMIRTYDSFGSPASWYKLYSSGSSVISSPNEALTLITGDLPSTTSGAWATAGTPNYGVFTDLNSPVISADGNLTYPIINPNGATSIAASAGANPILGFDITTASTPGYNSATAAGPTNNQAAMPVRWIYILQNGTQVPAVASGTAGTVTVAGATSSNPIVGRIAYWTDDETCKLNVNTAGDGSYYDTPRFTTAGGNPYSSSETGANRDIDRLIDKQLAISPPLGAEYQRFVGHPAQTKLSYAFPMSPSTAIGALDLGSRSQVFSNISPFMQWGGSEAGAYTIVDYATMPPLFPPQRQTPYATLDEWMFNTQLNSSKNRIPNADLNGTQIVNNLASPTSSQVNPSLQQLRFFLSATSEAPEVNLFGQPRIAIWPISSDYNAVTNPNSVYVTSADKLIARAASMLTPPTSGGTPVQVPYYFSRLNTAPSGSTLPGAQSQVNDYTKITRNQTIFQYLRTLANLPIPGYGQAGQPTFYTKYGLVETDQILTEIFDYIRCTNPSDTLLVGGGAGSATDYRYSKSSPRTSTSPALYVGSGQVVPISITPGGATGTYSTKGFGRFFSISELSIDFTQSQPTVATPTDSSNEIITALIHLNLFCPSLGPPNIIPDVRIEVDGLRDAATGTLTIKTNPAPAGNSGNTATPIFGPVTTGGAGRTVFSTIPEMFNPGSSNDLHDNPPIYNFLWGGAAGPRQLEYFHNSSYKDLTSTGASNAALPAPSANTGNFVLCGIPLKIPVGSTIHCSGGPLVIKISWANLSTSTGNVDPALNTVNGDGFPYSKSPGTSADLVQTITVNFPAFDVPAPTNSPYPGGTTSFSGRISNMNYGPSSGFRQDPVLGGDSVRSLVAGYNGDARLIAAQTTVTGTALSTNAAPVATALAQPFVYLPAATTTAAAHFQRDIFADSNFKISSFTASATNSFFPSGTSILASGAPSNVTYGLPTVNGYIADHSTTGSAATSPDGNGDFDNGIGSVPDGPYINKTDEGVDQYETYGYGNIYTGSQATYLSNPPYYGGGSNNTGAETVSYSSPDRAVASPVTFGSLSTGVPFPNATPAVPAVPWRTLLFRPQPTHFGATSPEDELLLDWFWMPVVDPYAISTPFATSGKVNMNYQIAPFTYITRATALMGVLGSEYVIAVPSTAGSTYKVGEGTGTNPTVPYRTPVRLLAGNGTTFTSNIDYTTGTLGQFKQRFDSGQIFRSACEICDINLVPNPTPTAATGTFNPTSASAAATFWASNALTGDNTRERPYNGLYPRLTTKSNTYTVHVRAQTLISPPNTPAGKWVENPALITSEYRGAVTINRYIDPQDPNIPDFATDAMNSVSFLDYSLDNYYKYRVLETRRFLP